VEALLSLEHNLADHLTINDVRVYQHPKKARGKAYVMAQGTEQLVFDSFLKRINRKRRDIDRLPPLGCLD
jgi:hypothetical protein